MSEDAHRLRRNGRIKVQGSLLARGGGLVRRHVFLTVSSRMVSAYAVVSSWLQNLPTTLHRTHSK